MNKLRQKFSSGKYAYFAKNSVLLTISSFGGKCLVFLLVPLYTNVLSEAEYGSVDILTTTSSILLFGVTVNIGDAVMRFSMDTTSAAETLLNYGLRVVFLNISIISPLILFFSIMNPIIWPEYYYLFLWMHLAITSIASVVTNYLFGIEKIREFAVSGLINTLVTICSNLIFLLYFRWGVVGYLVSIISGNLASLVYSIIKCGNLIYILKGAVCDKHTKTEMLKYSIPLVINGIAWWMNNSIDKYFIMALNSVGENGIYAVSSKIPTILGTINTVIVQAWIISAVKEFDKEDKDGFFGNIYSVYNAVIVLLCGMLILVNIPLAKILFAKKFFYAWKCSSWLLVSVLFNSLAGFLGSIFSAVKNSKAFAFSTITAAFINICMNCILIPRFQSVGAAVATVISFFSIWLIRYLYVKKYITLKYCLVRDCTAYIILLIQIIFESFGGHFYLGQIICILFLIVLYRKIILKIASYLLG